VILNRSVRLLWRRALPFVPPLLLALIVVIPLALFVWLLAATNIFTVQAITVVDAREHTAEAARALIEKRLAHTHLGRTIFFVPTKILETEIISALPQVRTAHITRKLPGTVKVIIQEKTPALLLLSNSRYYFVDDAGVPYEEARLETLPGIVLPVVKNDGTAGVTLGASAFSPEFVTFLRTIQEELPELAGGEVVEIRIPSLGAREVKVYLSDNWYINFDVTRQASAQLAILRQLLSTVIDSDQRTQIEYVDLRIPNRIYWRPRGS
jgi:cell division septal protein FtsQ